MLSMKKNVLIRMLIVVLGLGLLLTACKAGTNTDAGTEEPSTATEESTEAVTGGETEEVSTSAPLTEEDNTNPLRQTRSPRLLRPRMGLNCKVLFIPLQPQMLRCWC